MSLKKWELEADEFFEERTVYIPQQTVQKLSGAVQGQDKAGCGCPPPRFDRY
jgi:hypothetical protein